jgi:hypothetical protein
MKEHPTSKINLGWLDLGVLSLFGFNFLNC